MMRSCWVACAIVLTACGSAGAPRPETVLASDDSPPGCEAMRAEADTTTRALDACRGATPSPSWAYQETFDWLDAHIGVHLVAQREGQSAVISIGEAQEIADRVWTLLDTAHDEVTDRALLDRTELGAEALLRERDPDGRERALASLAGTLGTLRTALEPTPVATCDTEARSAAAASMGARVACTELASNDEL